MSNNELLEKIIKWVENNSYYQQGLLNDGPSFVYKKSLLSILNILKD